ncbi:MAG: PAS domain S-box protein [Actinomycetia bacterium]|nr:PAS domain S-box protein [Actinomycetes bacterium]
MDFLAVSIAAALASIVLLFAVFVYLATTERQPYLVSWSAAWGVYAVRLGCDLWGACVQGVDVAALVVGQAAAVGSSMLLLAGTYRYVGLRPPRRVLWLVGLVTFASVVVLLAMNVPTVWVLLPSFVVQGTAHIITGAAWWRMRGAALSWTKTTAVAFIAWGVHKFDFPFLGTASAFAPLGFMLSTLLAIAVALGVLVSYFEETRRRLQTSEAKYRALFEESASVMLVVDPSDGRVVDANRRAERFYGWSRQELRSMTIFDINTLPPDQVTEAMGAARTRGQSTFAFRHRLASGEVRDVQVFSGPIPSEDRELLHTIVHDVTEQRMAERALAESEERYRSLFFDSQQPMLLVDPADVSIVEANDAASAFYGYPLDQLRRMTVADVSVDERDRVLAEAAATASQSKQVGTYRHVVSDGSTRDVEIYSTPIRFGDRTLLYTILHDVTQRAEAERELAQYRSRLEEQVEARTAELRAAMEELESANRAKDDFLTSMSHELRTPLNSVIGFAHLLGEELPGRLNQEQHKQIEMIEGSGRLLLGLVNDVLDLAKIESGQVDVRMDDVDVSATVAEILDSLRTTVADKGVVLDAVTPPGIRMRTDPRLLQQILWNLLGNAIKYTEEGFVRARVEECGDCVLFEVSDSGPGMTAEQLDAAFDKFTRFQAPGGPAGTGLGLSIAKRLTEHLGGHLEAKSTPGEGSVFTLVLPRSSSG